MTNTANIWEDFSKPLYQFILQRVSTKEDAEDLLQESFIKIHTKLKDLSNEEKLTSWVFQVTRNTVNDFYRKKANKKEIIEFDLSDKPDLHDHVKDSLTHCLIPIINNLKPEYRDALLLSEVEGMKQQEVAKKLNIGLSAAKSRVQRGRELIKVQFVDHCNFQIGEDGKLKGEHLCDIDHDCHSCG